MSGWVRVSESWFEDEQVEEMSSDAIAFHLSALADCARNLRDGRVPTRALRRLRVVADQDAVLRELTAAGWWESTSYGWFIPDWQAFILSADEVEKRREQSRESTERHRRHKAGDHSLCSRCSAVRDQSRHRSRDASVTSPDPNRSDPKGRRGGESGATDPAGGPSAAPEQVRRLPSPHTFDATTECCPLPPEHAVHQEAAS